MDDESTGSIKRETIPELLDGPFSRWVLGDVPVKDSPRRDVENDEDIQPLERSGYDHEEVAREDRARMVVEERGPRLRRPAAGWPGNPRHIAPNRPRRHGEPELHPEFRRDALLTPRAIRRGDVRDQSLEVGGNARPSARLGLGAPEEAIEVSMPAYKRVGPNNRQQLPRGYDAREQREGDAGGVVGSLRSTLTFEVAGELLAQEEVLGRQVPPRSEGRSEQPQKVKE